MIFLWSCQFLAAKLLSARTNTFCFDGAAVDLAIVCLGVIAASCNNHGMEALNLFMPSEAPLPLAALLVPIETFAVFFKPVALGVRLFANTTAGLVLFKMAVAAAYFLIASSGYTPICCCYLTAVPVVLTVVKLIVAVVQGYIYAVLLCFYLESTL